MLKAYVNYPNPKVTVHHNPLCGSIQKMQKTGQRVAHIDAKSISVEIQAFKGRQYPFAANAGSNDMWIEVDFGDEDFEKAVLGYVHRLIGKNYSPLAKVVPNICKHC